MAALKDSLAEHRSVESGDRGGQATQVNVHRKSRILAALKDSLAEHSSVETEEGRQHR